MDSIGFTLDRPATELGERVVGAGGGRLPRLRLFSPRWTMVDKTGKYALLLAAALALPSFAAAQAPPAQASTPYLTGTCTSCHGPNGRSAGTMPSLAGLPQSYIVEQMKQFREGTRPATVMHQIAKGYTDQQTELLAAYFAHQSPVR